MKRMLLLGTTLSIIIMPSSGMGDEIKNYSIKERIERLNQAAKGRNIQKYYTEQERREVEQSQRKTQKEGGEVVIEANKHLNPKPKMNIEIIDLPRSEPKVVEQQFSSHKGDDHFDANTFVTKMRDIEKQIKQKTGGDDFANLSLDILKPATKQLIDFLQEHKNEAKDPVNAKELNWLIQTLTYKMQNALVTPRFLFNSVTKGLYLLSPKPNKVTLEIFRAVTHGKDYYRILKATPAQIMETDFLDFFEEGDESYETSLHYKLASEVDKYMDKLLPSQLPLFLFGEGILDEKDILLYLLQDTYPIGVPNEQELKFHGEQSSRFAFALHDDFHRSIDMRRHKLFLHIVRNLEKAQELGVNMTEEFMQQVIQLCVEKYNLVNEWLVDSIKRLDINTPNDKKILAGLFFMLHEFDYYPDTFFDLTDFENLFTGLQEYMKEYFSEDTSWFNPKQIIKSEVNGNLLMSTEEIKKVAMEHLSHRYGQETLKALFPVKFTIEKGQQFIFVTARFKNGMKEKIAWPKLNRKIRNYEAVKSTLSDLGGYEPLILPKNEEEFIDFQNTVNSQIVNLMSLAAEYLTKTPQEERQKLQKKLTETNHKLTEMISKK